MTAQILDGKHVAELTEAELAQRVEALKSGLAGGLPSLPPFLWEMIPRRRLTSK